MTEWLLLVLLVPAVVVPVVLLLGFAGCGAFLETGPEVPLITSAVPLDGHTARIDWTYNSTAPATFEIRRQRGVELPGDPIAIDAPPFVDSTLEPGPTFTYQVRSRLVSNGDISRWSAGAAIQTFDRAFSAGLEQGGSNGSMTGACIVQQLRAGSLSHGGNLIAVTVRAASDADLSLSRVTISLPAVVGNEFDSSAPPRDIIPSPIRVPAASSVPLTPVEFQVDSNQPLLIAFDVGDPGEGRFITAVGQTMYFKQGPPGTQITEAGTQNRAGFTELPDQLWLIDAVEVATRFPPLS